MRNFFAIIFLCAACCCFYSCKYDTIEPMLDGYPQHIGKIFSSHCATTGCHTTADKDFASGLDLSSWNALFNGARNGSPVIPFSSKYSFLCYFINSYPDLGIISDSIGNRMPPDPLPVLSHNDVDAIMTWINTGALSNFGKERFPNDASRKKIYAAMQSRDMVAVMDAASRQIMRYIKVGANDNVTELPHQIRISPDGQYWYVLFLSGQIVQRFRTFDDSFVDQAVIGPGNWNTMSVTPDGNHLFAADFSPAPAGKIVHVDLQTMTVTSSFDQLQNPHGTYFMQTQNVLYVTAQYGNFIYKFNFGTSPDYNVIDVPDFILMQTGASVNTAHSFDPHEIIFSADEQKYFVTCQWSNEVRIFNSANDMLLDSVSVGSFPQEMAISPARNLLFVTCQEDSASATLQPGEKGSVFVYNYQTN
ncbi:MAG TPA: YncE family protein, partial [Bacteroidia bacterium]|nr:YncE family protein [Bacteroidia bacterium]